MSEDYEVGYGRPPKHTRFRKGQSGNPKGRPKTRSDFLREAAEILSEPVRARTSEGQTVSLGGLEGAYLAHCQKGLQGHVPSLISAIRIMLEIQPALDDREAERRKRMEVVIEVAEKIGFNGDTLRERWGL